MFKKITLLALFTMLLNQPYINSMYSDHTTCTERESFETGAKFAFLTVVVASCTYALYKIGSWIFKKTDEQIYTEASNTYHQTKNEYNNLVRIWIQELAYTTQEHLLSALPIESASTIYNLGRSLQALEEHIKRIEERLQGFIKEKKYNQELEKNMKRLRTKIKELYKSLKPIHSYLTQHTDYYALANIVHTLKREFGNEISALKNNPRDEQIVHKILTSHIMSYAKKHRYPYIYYIENLSDKLNQLEKKIRNCERSYPTIEHSAQKMKEQLECIHSLVLIHSSYHNELQEQERNRLKEQKIALEKAKVRAQQDQARALEEQNWLRTQEIYNQERILRKLDKKISY